MYIIYDVWSFAWCSKRRDHNGSFQSQHFLHGCTRKFTSNNIITSDVHYVSACRQSPYLGYTVPCVEWPAVFGSSKQKQKHITYDGRKLSLKYPMSFRLARRKLRPLEWIQIMLNAFLLFSRKRINEMSWNFHRLVLLHKYVLILVKYGSIYRHFTSSVEWLYVWKHLHTLYQ